MEFEFQTSELHAYIYIWSMNSNPKSEVKMAEIGEVLDVPVSFYCFCLRGYHEAAGKECAKISYFDINLKNNTMVL